MTKDELEGFIFGELGFCGCGMPEAAVTLLRDVLQLIHDRSNHEERTAEDWKAYRNRLEAMLGKADALFYTYLYFLDSKGLIEHGSNISGCWLTKEGEDVLFALRSCDIEELCAPDEPDSTPDAESNGHGRAPSDHAEASGL